MEMVRILSVAETTFILNINLATTSNRVTDLLLLIGELKVSFNLFILFFIITGK